MRIEGTPFPSLILQFHSHYLDLHFLFRSPLFVHINNQHMDMDAEIKKIVQRNIFSTGIYKMFTI